MEYLLYSSRSLEECRLLGFEVSVCVCVISVLDCLRQFACLPHRLASLQASRESPFSIFLVSQQVLEYHTGLVFASWGLELSSPHLHKRCFAH